MSDTDLAWAAGFIDGEGCIGAYTNGLRSYHVLSLAVSQKYRQPLERLVELFGGTIRVKHNPKDVFEWRMGGDRAAGILAQLIPYLRTNKKGQAILAIQFQSMKQTNAHKAALSPFDWAERESYALAIKDLKVE